MTLFGRIVPVALAACLGWGVGWVVGSARHIFPRATNYPFLAERLPLPHHVPEHAGGVPFRFAMAHDVIHERFPKHGPAHYRERDRITRAALAKLDADDPARFPLEDDLGAGLERLGRTDEAIAVLRDKLARQKARGLSGRELYTSYANLGTFLIHGSFRRAMSGDAAAKAQFREGVAFIRQSVEVNPRAHFGRERWQAAIAEFLLAAMGDPQLLTQYDCLGNRLGLGIEEALHREANWVRTGYGRPTDAEFSQGKVDDDVPAFFRRGFPLADPSRWAEVAPIREHITKVGAEDGWEDVAVPSHRKPAPFDEPVLGMIGMWRQGGGANPHFALALGETMLRVGQRYIAWSAFERASRMADRFWPDPATQAFLRDHCRKRQAQIEETLAYRPGPAERGPAWQHVTPPPPKEVIARLRERFDAELAFGEAYQEAYQEFEAARIAAGVPIADEHFFDRFHAGRGRIASPIGPEEQFIRVPRSRMYAYGAESARACGLLGAGLMAMVTALVLRWREARRSRPNLNSFV